MFFHKFSVLTEINLCNLVKERLQISHLILGELINFYSPWNHQKTYGFLMISGKIEVNYVMLC